jgi:dihydrofolate reductase
MSKIVFVFAMADNGVIGDRGAIPWRIPEDMRHFKAVTMGKPFIVGRKTWDSFPKKPLPGRTNIVVTRDTAFRAEGAKVAHSIEDALALAEAENPTEICVAGGAEIYNILRDRAETVHLTEVHADFAGDAKIEKFVPPKWRETSREEHTTPDGLRYSFVTLEKAI